MRKTAGILLSIYIATFALPASAASFPTRLPSVKPETSRLGTNKNFQGDVLGLVGAASLDQGAIELMQANYGAVIPIPDIVQKMQSHLGSKDSAAAEKDRLALAAWDRYFKEMASELSGITVPVESLARHRALVRWVQYNRDFIQSTSGITSSKDAAAAYSAYKKAYSTNRAAIQNGFFSQPARQSLRLSLLGNLRFAFGSLFSRAEAQDDGDDSSAEEDLAEALAKEYAKAYAKGLIKRFFITPFGGVITIGDTCTTGELVTVAGPASGSFFLYWWVLALNPFSYKNVTNGNMILGEAFNYPGWCNKGYVNYTLGQGFILYFGTAASPGT